MKAFTYSITNTINSLFSKWLIFDFGRIVDVLISLCLGHCMQENCSSLTSFCIISYLSWTGFGSFVIFSFHKQNGLRNTHDTGQYPGNDNFQFWSRRLPKVVIHWITNGLEPIHGNHDKNVWAEIQRRIRSALM